MARTYDPNSMLKSRGIVYFPPVSTFQEAMEIYNECGGMILSLEEDGFLVDEPIKISRLYDIPTEHLELYFRDVLTCNNIPEEECNKIISQWLEEENISNLE